MFAPAPAAERGRSISEQEARTLADFGRHFGIEFNDPALLKLALTHRSYLSVTGQGPRESNERLEFLGDSVLGLVTSEFLYRQHPDEHEGQLTKTKSLLVSKAILSRRALAMGLGRFVLMSHSEVESGGRQRLSILADAFEAVLGAIYLDQGFEAARHFIDQWLLRESRAISSDAEHVNYKSYLQEYVQSNYHTHPVYRIRSEYGPDHSKHFTVDVMVGKRALGTGKGSNKKEAEQAAARAALEAAGALPRIAERASRSAAPEPEVSSGSGRDLEPRYRWEAQEEIGQPQSDLDDASGESGRSRRRGRRGGRGRRRREELPGLQGGDSRSDDSRMTDSPVSGNSEREPRRPAFREEQPRGEARREPDERATPEPATQREERPGPRRAYRPDDEYEEIGRPEGPLEERHVDPYDWDEPIPRATVASLKPVIEAREPAATIQDAGGRPREREEEDEFESAESRRSPAVEAIPARPATAGAPVTPAPVQFGRRSARKRPGSR